MTAEPAVTVTASRRRRIGSTPAIEFVLAGRKPIVGAIAAFSFLGGLTEAAFLVVVTRLAFGIADGVEEVSLGLGLSVGLRAGLALAAGLVLVRVGFAMAAIRLSVRTTSDVQASTRSQISSAFLDATWDVQRERPSGSLQELLTTYSQQTSSLVESVSRTIVASTNLAAMLVLAVVIDPLGAIVLVLAVAALSRLIVPLRGRLRRRADEANTAGMEFATALNEVSELGLELHVFGVQDGARARLAARIDEYRHRYRRQLFARDLVPMVYASLAYVALLGALAVIVQVDTVDLAAISAVMLVMLRSLTYGQAVQAGLSGIASTSPAVERLRAELGTLVDGKRLDHGEPVGSIGVLEVRNLAFAYDADQPVLRDVSFRIDPHEVVGIVGPSGGGKSTLVQLLLGLREPDSGVILADGRPIADFARSEWTRKITFVPQASHLISGTIADNIRFLRTGVSDDEVVAAARLAHLHDDVTAFPEGYERQVGQRGGHLSGGQQQRLCIARALVEHPDVLILDEPTSALDVRSEHLIRTTLDELRSRMSVIVIAHRLSTLDICDRIMVIQDGTVRAFDTPESLELDNEFYREALKLSGMR